jgi:thioredoxin reductase
VEDREALIGRATVMPIIVWSLPTLPHLTAVSSTRRRCGATAWESCHDIPPDIQADLARRKIPVAIGRIVEIAHNGGHITNVNLDTRRNIAVDSLFAHPRNKPSASLHESLGLATVDTPTGIVLKVDDRRQTSMPGIYAAGDLATPFLPSVTVASSQGAMAGIFAQQSMLE